MGSDLLWISVSIQRLHPSKGGFEDLICLSQGLTQFEGSFKYSLEMRPTTDETFTHQTIPRFTARCWRQDFLTGNYTLKYNYWVSSSTYAGYTPQDNRADFGPISPLPTILGNVLIILVVLKIILSDFPVVWGVKRICSEERRRIRPIANHKDQKSWCVGGNPEDTTHYSQYRRSLYAEYAVCLGHQLPGGAPSQLLKKKKNSAAPAPATARGWIQMIINDRQLCPWKDISNPAPRKENNNNKNKKKDENYILQIRLHS